MIHAYLFLYKKNYSRDGTDGHGEVIINLHKLQDFQAKMREINEITGLKITIFHSFIDEVESYAKHVWICNVPIKIKNNLQGRCRKRAPYFGIVKRSRNMAPGPYDYWWKSHSKNCGGEFLKVIEPENYK